MADIDRETRTVALYNAYCYTCGKKWGLSNAHGVAARHARARGHHVAVEKTIIYTYNYGDRRR